MSHEVAGVIIDALRAAKVVVEIVQASHLPRLVMLHGSLWPDRAQQRLRLVLPCGGIPDICHFFYMSKIFGE